MKRKEKMNKNDIIRQRNIELSQEIEELKSQIDVIIGVNADSVSRANELIMELEEIKRNWLKALEDVCKQRDKYDELIMEMKEFKSNVNKRKGIDKWTHNLKR